MPGHRHAQTNGMTQRQPSAMQQLFDASLARLRRLPGGTDDLRLGLLQHSPELVFRPHETVVTVTSGQVADRGNPNRDDRVRHGPGSNPVCTDAMNRVRKYLHVCREHGACSALGERGAKACPSQHCSGSFQRLQFAAHQDNFASPPTSSKAGARWRRRRLTNARSSSSARWASK